MVRWLLNLVLASWLSGALALSATSGSKIGRQLLPLEGNGLVSVESRRALLATQATDSSSAEEADKQTDVDDSVESDDCNLRQDDLDLCVCAGLVCC